MSADDNIPESIPEHQQGTGEVTMMAPEEASKVMAGIKAVADSRGDDSDVVELIELRPTGPIPIPTEGREDAPDDQLGLDDLRDAWPFLDLEERGDGLRVLPREDAEEFFISLSSRDQADLLLNFRPGQRRQWMRLLEPDDVADVIQQAGEANRTTLLALLDDPTRREVVALLKYAEDEAGGLMSTRYARLRPEMSADEALLYLRRQARAKLETIYVAYVLDPAQRLLGVVSFRDLFAADPKTTVAEIMTTDIVRVTDEMDQETVSRFFAEHDLNVIPVVDMDGKMKGIVTVDDIVDVVQEEATEDAQKFGGLEALDMPYLASSRREMVTKRGRWLVILLLGEMFTATALGFFQGELDKAIVLSLFLPLIISSGGNSGSQASTLVIRAMALGEVRVGDWLRVFRREIQMGVVLGAILGAVVSIRVIVWGAFGAYSGSAGMHYVMVGLTVATAVVGCVTWGTLMGAMLPFALRRIGADPASASAPLVATLVDVSGIVIYFVIASFMLTNTVIRTVPNTATLASRDELGTVFGDRTLVLRPDSPRERENTSLSRWIGVTGTLTMRAAITEKGTFDDGRDDAATATDVPGLGEAAYYEPAAQQLTVYQHDTLLTVSFAGTLPPATIRAAEEALVAKIVPRL
ncbi:MAG TPA: magnesium transporter [Kofleriaceae bacterium]|jgi:magnesium transporter